MDYHGIIHDQHLKHIKANKNIDLAKFEDFAKGHALLIYDYNKGSLIFRYDFFTSYFKMIYISEFLKKMDFSKINQNIIDAITQNVSYDNDFTNNLAARLKGIDFNLLKEIFFMFINTDIDSLEIHAETQRRFVSSLFILLLILNPNNNKSGRTEILKEIYGKDNDEEITGLSIIDLHNNNGNKITFDFSNLKFSNCYFENYDAFSECIFNSNTYFKRTTFIAPLYKEGGKIHCKRINFDFSTCELNGIIEFMDKKESIENNETNTIRNKIKKILRFFWENGTFKQKLASEARKKLNTHTLALDNLIENKIILTTSVKSKQKSTDQAYYLNPKYSNLRKIFEENKTCYELETIIKIIN
jgi:hypothetical protein